MANEEQVCDNYDLVALAIDEIVDDGIILYVDGNPEYFFAMPETNHVGKNTGRRTPPLSCRACPKHQVRTWISAESIPSANRAWTTWHN